MCGIYGFVKGLGEKSITTGDDYILQATKVGVLRGEDSTGIYQVDANKKPFIHKLAMHGAEFANTKHANNIIRDTNNCPITIGHHRLATHGRICNDNAHPFMWKRKDGTYVVGVHNGIVSGYKKEEDGHRFDVDSEWVFYRLMRDGKKAYEDFNGSYALAYYDSSEDTFNLGVGFNRTLHFAFVKNKDAMLLASEGGMIRWLAERNNLDIETVLSCPSDRILVFPKNQLRKYEQLNIPHKVYKAAPYKPTGKYNTETNKWEPNDEDYVASWLKKDDEVTVQHSEFEVGDDDGIYWGDPKSSSKSGQEGIKAATAARAAPASKKRTQAIDFEIEAAKAKGIAGAVIQFRLTAVDPVAQIAQGYATFEKEEGEAKAGQEFPAMIRNMDFRTTEVQSSFRGVKQVFCKVVGLIFNNTTDGIEWHVVLDKPHHMIYGTRSTDLVAAGSARTLN